MEAISDIEKHPVPTTVYPAASEMSATGSSMTPLHLFQLLVGIHTPESLTQGKRAYNTGIYQQARQNERRERWAYLMTSFISNALFLVQILVAAVITALSAYKESNPIILTVLGAFNTVLAGCLAWQKGQGVPHRYRKAQDQYQALILDIEMTERAFIENATLDPRAELARLQKIFDSIKSDQQANYPDNFVSMAAQEAKELERQLQEAKAESTRVQKELLAKIESLLIQPQSPSSSKST